MHYYKVYYQYWKFASVNFKSVEYASKRELLTGEDYNDLEEFISNLIESKEVCVCAIFPITKLSSVKKREKQVEVK